MTQDELKAMVGEAATAWVQPGSVIGVGTGIARAMSPGFGLVVFLVGAFGFMFAIERTKNSAAGVPILPGTGTIETEALAPYLTPERRERMVSTTPLQRLGQPEDIANAAVFLASPAASWITGKVLGVDGGVEAPNF